jgi:uncharacterized protein (DUF1015 family)
MRPDELGRAFIVRLVILPQYKDGQTNYHRLGVSEDEESNIVRLDACIMRLVPVFILRTHNQTNNK